MGKQLLLIALGGGAGSMLRFLTGHYITRLIPAQFPLATGLVNVTGCFVMGILIGWLVPEQLSNQPLRLLLVTGFCGGYTTFSAFSYENVLLISNNQLLTAFGYIFASVAAGILAVWAGLKLSGT